MWNWLRELYDIRDSRRAALEVCKSCETLKIQLERANYEREQLINHLLRPPQTPQVLKAPVPVTQPLAGRHVPFRVRQQILEAESREEARILHKHQEDLKKATDAIISKPADTFHIDHIDTSPQVEELEQELGIK